MYRILRSLLFRLDPETAHNLTINLLRIAGVTPVLNQIIEAAFKPHERPVTAFGLRFKNPVGLAAGYDKDGVAWRGLALLGFGHVEIGTVTPQPQSGNSRPRLFRLIEQEALINQLGFPGRGSKFVEANISQSRPAGIKLGVNLGKNAATPLHSALEDYQSLIRIFYRLADYLVINISSPNTQGLRRLQARFELENLLKGIVDMSRELSNFHQSKTPILIKISPDLSQDDLEDALDIIMEFELDGVVATNTTIDRKEIDPKYSGYRGGLSGKPLASRSTEKIRMISNYTGGKLPIIGVGGIMDASDALSKFEAGADLIQIYTGLVYRGPGLVKKIIQDLPDKN